MTQGIDISLHPLLCETMPLKYFKNNNTNKTPLGLVLWCSCLSQTACNEVQILAASLLVSLLTHLKSSTRWPKDLSPCHPCARPRWNCRLSCNGNESVGRRPLCASLPLTSFQKIYKPSCRQLCMLPCT